MAVLTTLGAAPAVADSAGTTPATGFTPTRTEATPAPADEPSVRVLPDAMRGRAAVRALGERLAGVAERNDLSAPELKQLLTEDHTAWLSAEGQVFYKEDAPAEVKDGASGVTALANLAPSYPTSQTFSLHSRAGAARTIFLDFDGATIQGTRWNIGNGGDIANGSHIGWDSDASPTTFNVSEHGWIQEVWREVAEAYAPRDVDVTTQDPGQAAWTRSSTSDTQYGTRVLITSSAVAKSQACGGCLGVAWLGTFDAVDASAAYQPAWVFADDPGFSPMIIAQAAAHETGHTLGLHHDGLGTSSYYAGTSAWGPIMGSARIRAVSQFSLGEYVGANQSEDDFAVMQANGLPQRPDDHGSSTGTADQLGARTSYDVTGVIGSRTDNDVFAVNLSCTTDLTVSANGIGPQTTLDLSLTVLDAAGSSVASSSPLSAWSGSPPVSNGMNANATVTGATGTYYLRLDGVGNGSAAAAGWSDYGSLGQYLLTASGCPTVTQPPPPEPTPTQPPPPEPTPTPTTAPTPTAPAPAATRPGAPVIRVASSGVKRGPVTAVARWSAPTRTGGAAITKYRVRALRLNRQNRVVRAYGSSYLRPTTRALTMRLPKARYVFSVMAWNRTGASAWSRNSGIVRGR